MYKFLRIIKILLISFCLILITCENINAKEKVNESDTDNYLSNDYLNQDYSRIDRVMKENNVGITFSKLVKDIRFDFDNNTFSVLEIPQKCVDCITANRKSVQNVILIGLFSAIIAALKPLIANRQFSETASLMLSMTLIIYLTAIYIGALDTAKSALSVSITVYEALMPIFMPVVAAVTGSVSVAAFYQLSIMLCNCINIVLKNVGIIFSQGFVLLGFVDNISGEERFTNLRDLLDKGIKLICKYIFIIFVSLTGIKSVIYPVTDSIKRKYLVKAMGLIPGVGDLTDTVSESLIGATVIAKNALGITSIIVIIMIAIVPLIKLFLLSAIFNLITALLEPVADKKYTKAVKVLSVGLGELTRIVMVSFGIFIISIALICAATNIM